MYALQHKVHAVVCAPWHLVCACLTTCARAHTRSQLRGNIARDQLRHIPSVKLWIANSRFLERPHNGFSSFQLLLTLKKFRQSSFHLYYDFPPYYLEYVIWHSVLVTKWAGTDGFHARRIQWRNEGGAGEGGRPRAQVKKGAKMSLPVYILIYLGSNGPQRGR